MLSSLHFKLTGVWDRCSSCLSVACSRMCENGATLKSDSCTCGCADGYGGDNCESESLHTTPMYSFIWPLHKHWRSSQVNCGHIISHSPVTQPTTGDLPGPCVPLKTHKMPAAWFMTMQIATNCLIAVGIISCMYTCSRAYFWEYRTPLHLTNVRPFQIRHYPTTSNQCEAFFQIRHSSPGDTFGKSTSAPIFIIIMHISILLLLQWKTE